MDAGPKTLKYIFSKKCLTVPGAVIQMGPHQDNPENHHQLTIMPCDNPEDNQPCDRECPTPAEAETPAAPATDEAPETPEPLPV